MAKKHPVTAAVRALRAAKVTFVPHLYPYVERGGTQRSAAELGVDEREVIKTIVLETDAHAPVLALMHGDSEVSTKALARVLGVKTVAPADPATATRHTGYMFGGTSPFGTRKPLPVFAPPSVAALERLFINGGKRGFLVELCGADLVRALELTLADIATP